MDEDEDLGDTESSSEECPRCAKNSTMQELDVKAMGKKLTRDEQILANFEEQYQDLTAQQLDVIRARNSDIEESLQPLIESCVIEYGKTIIEIETKIWKNRATNPLKMDIEEELRDRRSKLSTSNLAESYIGLKKPSLDDNEAEAGVREQRREKLIFARRLYSRIAVHCDKERINQDQEIKLELDRAWGDFLDAYEDFPRGFEDYGKEEVNESLDQSSGVGSEDGIAGKDEQCNEAGDGGEDEEEDEEVETATRSDESDYGIFHLSL